MPQCQCDRCEEVDLVWALLHTAASLVNRQAYLAVYYLPMECPIPTRVSLHAQFCSMFLSWYPLDGSQSCQIILQIIANTLQISQDTSPRMACIPHPRPAVRNEAEPEHKYAHRFIRKLYDRYDLFRHIMAAFDNCNIILIKLKPTKSESGILSCTVGRALISYTPRTCPHHALASRLDEQWKFNVKDPVLTM